MNSPATPQPDPYAPLRVIMDAHDARCTPRDFYWAVNEAFHTAESREYDDIHAGMFLGSEDMWRRLAAQLPDGRNHILDVGAGTGLVGEYLFRLAPEKVGRLTMLDPNAAMLERSRQRSAGWATAGFEVEFVQGEIGAVAGRAFDAITISSVMHHVVEIADFCADLRRLVRPGGVLLQMQDPRAEAQGDAILDERRRAARARRRPSMYRRARAAARGVLTRLGRPVAEDPVCAATNAQLIERGVIGKRMSAAAIWAVTDIHVPGQPGGIGHGFRVDQFADWLAPMVCRDSFTYEFQGLPWNQLTPAEQQAERDWFAADDKHGAIMGSAWRAPPRL